MKNIFRTKNFKVLTAAFIIVMLLNISNTVSFASNINNTKTGFLEETYDSKAVKPLTDTWSRQSSFNCNDYPFEKWKMPVHYFHSDTVIGSDNTIYYVESITRESVSLHAVNPDGTEKWVYPVPHKGQSMNSSNPVIGQDGTIYFIVGGDIRSGFIDRGSLVAVKPNGELKWIYQSETDICDLRGIPVIATNGEIYLTAYGREDIAHIIAISPDGKNERKIITLNKSNINNSIGISIDKNNTIYISFHEYRDGWSYYGKLISLDSQGKIKWQIKNTKENELFSSPVVIGSDGNIYTTKNNRLVSYSTNGKLLWQNNEQNGLSLEHKNVSAPILADDGHIYVISNIADPNTGFINAFDSTGNLIWQFKTDGYMYEKPIVTQDGTLYCISQRGVVYALNSDGIMKWKYETNPKGRNWTSISLGNDGTIYFFLSEATSSKVLFSLGTKNISLEMNGNELVSDTAPKLISGRVLVPVRAILEEMGAFLDWVPATKQVIITKDDTTIEMTIDSEIVTLNGEKYSLDVPACLINSRTYIPVRFIAESFGADVTWDGDNKIVVITYE